MNLAARRTLFGSRDHMGAIPETSQILSKASRTNGAGRAIGWIRISEQDDVLNRSLQILGWRRRKASALNLLAERHNVTMNQRGTTCNYLLEILPFVGTD